MGLSWPAAQEYIPTIRGADWPGQTGASMRAGGIERWAGASQERNRWGQEWDFLGRHWATLRVLLLLLVAKVKQQLMISIHIFECSSER